MVTAWLVLLLLGCLGGGYAVGYGAGRLVGRAEEKRRAEGDRAGERVTVPFVQTMPPPRVETVPTTTSSMKPRPTVTVQCVNLAGQPTGTKVMGRRTVTTTHQGKAYVASHQGSDGVWVYREVGKA